MLWVKVLRGRREYVFSVQKVINPKKINLLGFIFWWDGGNRMRRSMLVSGCN